MAEAEDLKSSQCGFDPHSGHFTQIAKVINTALKSRFRLKNVNCQNYLHTPCEFSNLVIQNYMDLC